jgi:hypothetical protein
MNVGKDRQFDVFQINAYISFGRIFLLSGFADMVACFQCGLTHKTFHQDDDPIIIHIKLKPQCPYITGLRNEGILSCKDLMEDSLEIVSIQYFNNHRCLSLKHTGLGE